MSNEETIVSEAMKILRSRRSPESVERAVAAATAARRGKPLTEEHKAALRQAQAARRERERAERGAIAPAAVKRPRGRPKKAMVQE